MTVDMVGVLKDAWRLWKRDRELVLGVAGLFLFLPLLANEWLVAPLPAPSSAQMDEAAVEAWMLAVRAWSASYSLIVIAIGLVVLFGTLTLFTLYLDRDRPDARGALSRALTLMPRFLVASLLISIPIGFGWLLFMLPGIYAQARLMLTAPALVADRSAGAVAAIRRSIALSRGRSLALVGLACLTLVGGTIIATPFRWLGGALNGAPMANPVIAILLDAAAAAGETAGAVATILIQIALYRRLVASNGI